MFLMEADLGEEVTYDVRSAFYLSFLANLLEAPCSYFLPKR